MSEVFLFVSEVSGKLSEHFGFLSEDFGKLSEPIFQMSKPYLLNVQTSEISVRTKLKMLIFLSKSHPNLSEHF